MKMRVIITVVLSLYVLSGCTHKSAGVHINSNGKGGVYMKGGVLKF